MASPTDFFEHQWPKMTVALLLTFASGLVDISGYLGVFHFFTAHLTGTTVQLGHSLVAGRWIDVLAASSIVGAFMTGSVFGRALIEIGSRNQIRRIASICMIVEGFLLVAAIRLPAGSTTSPYGRLALLAGAMGIQTATLTGIGPLTVHTTFVTGMLNKIAQLLSHIAFQSYDLRRAKSPPAYISRDLRRDIGMTLFLFAIWLFYVGGAATGTWGFDSWGLPVLRLAIVLLAIGVITDQFAPLSIREEKEQSEE